MIEEHHFLFKKLHPSSNLLKKHHNMVHYPNCIREIENLNIFKTISFEGKHSFIKSAASLVKNSINILYSVSKLHQIKFFLNLMSDNFLNKNIEVLKLETFEIKNLTNFDLVQRMIEVCSEI